MDMNEVSRFNYEEGPVREKWWEEAQSLQNLKKFASDEGYTPDDIKEVLNTGSSKKRELMARAVARLKFKGVEVVPNCFDQWKRWVKLRKIMMHWLRWSALRGDDTEVEKQWAFNKWKYSHFDAHKKLIKKNLGYLKDRAKLNMDAMDATADHMEDTDHTIGHLTVLRNALMENYVKGQKLALILGKDNRQYGMKQRFHKWHFHIRDQNIHTKAGRLNRNMDLIAELRQKIAKMETENAKLHATNEDLRKFSMDGFEIAKAVHHLSGEREKLSVDLADKAVSIRKLLDDNEKLTQSLHSA